MKRKLLALIPIFLFITGCNKTGLPDNMKLIPDASLALETEKYSNSIISLDLPQNFEVIVSEADYNHYTFKVVNKDDPNIMLFFNLKSEGFTKSGKAKSIYINKYPDLMYGRLPSIEDKTSKYYYSKWNEIANFNKTSSFTIPSINELSVVSSYNTSPSSKDIIIGTFKNNENTDMTGIFTVTFKDADKKIIPDELQKENKDVDLTPVNAFDTIFVIAPSNVFINYKDYLLSILSSIKFSENFSKGFTDEENTVIYEATPSDKIYASLSNDMSLMWSNINKEDLIAIEKKNDTKEELDRVIDTKTGNIYKTRKTFMDFYSGERYKLIEDTDYLKKVSGFIEVTEGSGK